MLRFILTYIVGLSLLLSIPSYGSKAHTVNANTEGEKTEEKLNLEIVEIYPNPAVDYFYLKFDDLQTDISNLNIEVRSFIGNKLQIQTNVESDKLVRVDISQIPAGHYYAIISVDGEKVLKKFVKRA